MKKSTLAIATAVATLLAGQAMAAAPVKTTPASEKAMSHKHAAKMHKKHEKKAEKDSTTDATDTTK